MGAIFGILGEAGPGELDAMGRRLAHRGPGAGAWSPAPACRFGQRGGACSPELPLAVDGRIDNPQEVAALLGADAPSEPAGDPQLLLWRLFQRHGPQAARHLDGQFAIAFWDAGSGRLVLVRDRYGARPLYLVHSAGRIAFASEYKALLALEDVIAAPNPRAIRHVQCTRYPMADETLLAGVVPVVRGAWTALHPRDAARISRHAVPPRVAIVPRSEAGHVAALREAFLAALRRQAAPFDTLGIQLSGGLDSALVLGGLRSVRPDATLHSFTAGHGSDDPEIQAAAALADHFGTLHHPLVLEPEEIPALLPTTVWHMEEPFGREDQVYLLVLAREAAKHVRVLQSGYAADMSLGGMPRHRLARLAMQVPVLRRPLAEFYRHTQVGLPPRGLLGRALVSAYFRGPGRRFPPPRVMGTDYEPESDPLHRTGSEPFSEFLARGLDDVGWEQLETLHVACGLEFNAPFLSREFVDCTLSIPDRLKIRRGVQKWALREAGRGLVPDEVLRRGKTLQRLKHDQRFSDVLDALAEDLLAPAALRARGLFDPAQIEGLRRRPAGRPVPSEQAYRLWTLIETELWCRLFLDGRGRPPA